jgi:hypothetical protein
MIAIRANYMRASASTVTTAAVVVEEQADAAKLKAANTGRRITET